MGQAASVLVQDVSAKVYCAECCRGWDSIAAKMESHAVAVRCRRLKCMAEHCCALQCVAVDGRVLQSLLSPWTRLQQQCTAECCSVLQSVREVPSNSMTVTAVSCRPIPLGVTFSRTSLLPRFSEKHVRPLSFELRKSLRASPHVGLAVLPPI